MIGAGVIREPIVCADCVVEGKRALILAELIVHGHGPDVTIELRSHVREGHGRIWREAIIGERIRCGSSHGGQPGYVTIDARTIAAARRRAGVPT